MPKYSVLVTRTVESFLEIEVSAKDETAARDKAETKIQKAIETADALDRLNWDCQNTEGSFDYEVSAE